MPCIIDGNKSILTPVGDILRAIQSQLYVSGSRKLRDIQIKGKNALINCPIHKEGCENKPSCNILLYDEHVNRFGKSIVLPAGTVHCFACGYKANLVKFTADCLGVSYRRAAEWLLNFVDYELVEQSRDIDLDFDTGGFENNYNELPIITSEDLKKYDYIHQYMFDRHLTAEIIEKYEVGYSPEEDALTFPVYVDGRCLFVAKRKVKYKRFDMPEINPKPIYGMDYIDPYKDVYVCESVINALTLCTYGLQAVALFGTGSDYQIDLLNKSLIRKVILCLDGDTAGKNGTRRLLNGLKNKIVLYKEIPAGKDVNDLTKEEFFNLQENF